LNPSEGSYRLHPAEQYPSHKQGMEHESLFPVFRKEDQ